MELSSTPLERLCIDNTAQMVGRYMRSYVHNK